MVIVVIGRDQIRASALGAALAGHLGWPMVAECDDATVSAIRPGGQPPFTAPGATPPMTTEPPKALALLIAAVLGRRQHLVVVVEASDADRAQLRARLGQVRVICLESENDPFESRSNRAER